MTADQQLFTVVKMADDWHELTTLKHVMQLFILPTLTGWLCLAAGKVTVGLESHWPHVTDISGYPSACRRPRRAR